MTELTHWIDGAHVKGGSGRFADVFNPATGEVPYQLQNPDYAFLECCGPISRPTGAWIGVIPVG